jgi:chorismate mutase / prephenate dehydratase
VSLEELRKQIDDLDLRLIKLIAERMEIIREVRKEKLETGSPIEDRSREQAVLNKVKQFAEAHDLNPVEIEKIFQRIFYISKEAQGATVAFQGEPGAYSEEAAFSFFGPTARLKPCESLEDVFQAVERDETRYGLVPVENSLEGSIPRTYDLLLDSNLSVCGETQLRIVHCLIGLPEARLDTIHEVYSHTQALGQCKSFLRQIGWKQHPAADTAGSVKFIKEQGDMKKAAIASARAAEIYGMKILVRGIEDNDHNFTRFFILSKQDAWPSGKDKTSIVFSVKHKPGALFDALKALAEKRINLTRIESRPTRLKAWEYNFYVDVEGHRKDEAIQEALREMEKHTILLKILGSYPKAS